MYVGAHFFSSNGPKDARRASFGAKNETIRFVLRCFFSNFAAEFAPRGAIHYIIYIIIRMEKFSELIRLRRSMRKFTSERVSADDARLLLRAGLMAPSSKGLHSWEFVMVEDSATIERLSHCKAQGADFLGGAPLLIVVAANPEVSDVWIEDASVASTMILLQAEDIGLGACWVQVRERQDDSGHSAEDNVRSILGLPERWRILSIIAVGHKGMERKPFNEERLLWDKVHAYSPMIPLEF